MRKKGISPMIATVLLIVFVIVVAIIIFNWAFRLSKEGTQKSGDKVNAQDICRDNVEIKVSKIRVDGDELKVDIENLKSKEISDFVVRLEGRGRVDIKKIKQRLGGYERNVLSVGRSFNPEIVKVIPQITLTKPEIISMDRGWWLCSEKMVVYDMSVM